MTQARAASVSPTTAGRLETMSQITDLYKVAMANAKWVRHIWQQIMQLNIQMEKKNHPEINSYLQIYPESREGAAEIPFEQLEPEHGHLWI